MGNKREKKTNKRQKNDKDEVNSSPEKGVTPKRNKRDQSEKKSVERKNSNKKSKSSCRRRLQEALDFASENGLDDNNNALASYEDTGEDTDLDYSSLEGMNKELSLKQNLIERVVTPKTNEDKNYKQSTEQNSRKQCDTIQNRAKLDKNLNKKSFTMHVDLGDMDLENENESSSDEDEEMLSQEEDDCEAENEERIVEIIQPEKEAEKFNLKEIQERPGFQELMMKMIKETFGQMEEEKEKKRKEIDGKTTSKREYNTNRSKSINKVVKSPSDTTIYVPALKQRCVEEIKRDECNINSKDSFNEVSAFVEKLRVDEYPRDQPSTSRTQPHEMPVRKEISTQQDKARRMTNDMIIDAERHKERVAPPTGRLMIFENSETPMGIVPQVDVNFNDDDVKSYCHGTAHVEKNTADKIELGKLVDLNKLVPNMKQGRSSEYDENRLEFCSKEGRTFFIPCGDKETFKINGIRSWEKAFRVYATIYTRANPHRAVEIYQYVHSINLAASSFSWENVAYYDYNFRKIMSDNPQRSWEKITHSTMEFSHEGPKT